MSHCLTCIGPPCPGCGHEAKLAALQAQVGALRAKITDQRLALTEAVENDRLTATLALRERVLREHEATIARMMADNSALTASNEALTRDLDDVKARALSVNRGLTADNLMLKDALSAMTQESNQRGEALQALLTSKETAGQMLRDAQARCCEHLSRLTAAETAQADLQADGITEETQDRIRDLISRESGCTEIDGSGSDAGPVEFTLAEIGQGFAYLKDTHQTALAEAKAEIERQQHNRHVEGRMHQETERQLSESQAALREAGTKVRSIANTLDGPRDTTGIPVDEYRQVARDMADALRRDVLALPAMQQALAARE